MIMNNSWHFQLCNIPLVPLSSLTDYVCKPTLSPAYSLLFIYPIFVNNSLLSLDHQVSLQVLLQF
jgi:hypothetical protein